MLVGGWEAVLGGMLALMDGAVIARGLEQGWLLWRVAASIGRDVSVVLWEIACNR